MKKIMKKNQVIITSLAILIAVAGYLNFADVNLGSKDKEASTDSSSILEDVDYDISEETALLEENGEEIGEPLAQDTGTPARRSYRRFQFCGTGKIKQRAGALPE